MAESAGTKTVVENGAEHLLEGGGEPSINSPGTTKLDLSGSQEQNVKLDGLGPMVVNSDGTLSRIANWENMTDLEKERTLRVLSVRNKLRLAKQAAEIEADSSSSVSALKDDIAPQTAREESQPQR